jgi:hypothetical protein
MIYFIRNTETGRIKIGYSHDPDWRIKNLQTGSDAALEVILKIPGGYKEECFLRNQFRDYHYRGEWFNNTGELYKYIKDRTIVNDQESIEELIKKLYGDSGVQTKVDWGEVAKVYFTTTEESDLNSFRNSSDLNKKTPYLLIGCLTLVLVIFFSVVISWAMKR